MISVSSIARWMREQYASTARGAVVRFELQHQPTGKRPHEVSSASPEETPDAAWFDNAAASLFEAARANSEGYARGTQHYGVVVYRADAPDRGMSCLAFSVPPSSKPSDAPDGHELEQPDVAGVTIQLMRHLENRERTFTAAMATLTTSLKDMANSLAAENDELRAQRLKDMETVEALLTMQHERELEAKKADAHIEVVKDAARELKLLAPAIVNRLAGREVIPANDDARTMQIERFAESLTDEQKVQIAGHLSPGQQVALAELIRPRDN